MRAKTKYKVGIWLMVIIVIVGVASAIVVGKLIKESSYSNLTVSYNSTGVQGTAYANLYYGDQVFNLTTNGLTTGNKKIAFTGREKQDKAYHLYVPTNQKGESSDIVLNAQNTQIVFEYAFSNTSSTNWLISLSMVEPSMQNVNVFFCCNNGEQITDFSLISESVSTNQIVKDVVVNSESVTYVYLKLSVADVYSNASFTGNLLWDLKEVK